MNDATHPDHDDTADDVAPNPDAQTSTDDPSLTEYDKTLADSFPSSDPPATP